MLLLPAVLLAGLLVAEGEALLHLLTVGRQEGQGRGELVLLAPLPANYLETVDLTVDPSVPALLDRHFKVPVILLHTVQHGYSGVIAEDIDGCDLLERSQTVAPTDHNERGHVG